MKIAINRYHELSFYIHNLEYYNSSLKEKEYLRKKAIQLASELLKDLKDKKKAFLYYKHDNGVDL